MTDTDRGRWFRVYARSVEEHDKFRHLSAIELGAWTALRSAAELRDRAVIRDRAEAVLILRRRKVARPSSVLDRLVELRLFDQDDAGRITVHDRADHDRPKAPSDDPDEVRKRVRRHRESKGNESGNDHETSGNEFVTEARAPAPNAGAGAASDSTSDSEGGPGGFEPEPLTVPEGWDAVDAVVAYHATTGRYPSDGVIEWLNRMSNDHPEEAIAQVLAEQYAENPNLGTLMSRTENALKLDAHRRQKADERARAKAKANAEAPHREKEREATPEEREQARFQRQAIRLGLKLGIPVPTDAEDVRKFVMKHGAAS